LIMCLKVFNSEEKDVINKREKTETAVKNSPKNGSENRSLE